MRAKKIVILMYQYSVVVKGIENKLIELGYNVEIVSNEFNLAKNYASDVALFLVYLPGNIAEDERRINTLSKILEMAVSRKTNLILLGEMIFHAELSMKLPEINSFEWVNKPIDMEKFCPLVDKLVNEQPGSTPKKRILIVDDDPAYAKMVREWIKDIYKVDIVTAGMQAISFLLKVPENEQVDMILLDYEMPVVDGPQVLQMLRQDPATEHIPVIFLTGVGTKEAVGRVMALKPDGYILKTTPRGDLLGFLHKKLS